MPLFGRKKERKENDQEKQIAVVDQEEKLHEEVTALDEGHKDRTLDTVLKEVGEKVQEAARHSIQEVKLLEQGRCPDCGSKLEQFLYTSICTSCGYSKRLSPEVGKVLLHLNDGATIECDKTFEVRDGIQLCVKDDVVIARLNEPAISYVEFLWTAEELGKIRDRRDRETVRPCNWCTRRTRPKEKDTTEVFLAVGMHQDKYFFCSDKCAAAFRKQYPSRVHRDCYERDCADCDECIKRYDTSGRRI